MMTDMQSEPIEFSGELLRKLREARELSRQRMEGETEIPYQTLKAWEKGWRKPNEENLSKLNTYFDTNMIHKNNDLKE